MPLEPLHPDEPSLHHALRDALNQSLTSADFFVLISVEPTGEVRDFDDLAAIVADAEQWLSGLNPDAVDASDLPTRRYSDKAAYVEVRAIPKKPSARNYRPAEIVGNPEPALAGWVP